VTGNMTYRDATWPELPLSAWKDTYATLHLWTQIVGKIRLAQTPWLNHSWHVVLYVSAGGLTTSAIPYGDRSFQLDFDFLDHVLRASASDGGQEEIGLYPRSVADFYAEVMRSLAELGINIRINELPNEIPDAIRFRGIASTPPTPASTPSASGAYSFSPHAFSAGSARASSASAARSISSGAASISP
jgi:uncharacterized protein DUF5996